MILTVNDFKVEAQIPGMFPAAGTASPNNLVVQERVQGFIAKYEPDFLLKFFNMDRGRAEALEEYSGMPEAERTDDLMNRLVEALKAPLSHYVAFHYLRHQTVTPTRIGGVVMQGENGRVASNSSLCVLLWNQMCEMNIGIYEGILGGAVPATELFRMVTDTNL